MPISQNLALYAYQLNNASARNEYGAKVESLEFSTTAPGGWGHLTAELRVEDSTITPPELSVFSNVALMGAGFACFEGRWDEPSISMDDRGTLFTLSAMGGATNLKDDPESASYTAQTAVQIISDQLTNATLKRNATCLLDTDTSGISLGSDTFTIAFTGETIENVLNKLLPLIGDTVYYVWDHPSHKDAAGFPTWQLYSNIRDTSSANLAYSATFDDLNSFKITPSAEIAYNVVTLFYKDATTLAPSSITVTDSRLNANGSQGSAPFPWKLLRMDKSNVQMSATQAANFANGLLGQYKSVNFKIEVELKTIRDLNGNILPLWMARAGKLIELPDLATIGAQLPTTYTLNQTMFWISETTYSERSGQTPRLTLTSATFADRLDWQFQRLEYQAQLQQQNLQNTGVIQAAGVPEIGSVGLTAPSIALGGNVFAVDQNFKTTMASVPTSVTLTANSSSNIASATATNITRTGFTFSITTSSNGTASWHGTYKTNGN